jgi:hypothetical protein
VERLTMLVTPDGRWVFPNSEEFLALLGDNAPDYDAISFAVKNLGFIKFQIIGQSIIEIDLHPRNVELPALLATQQQVLSCRIDLFRIQHFDTRWHSEISSSPEHTIARLSELCAPVFTPPPTERFLVEPRDYTAIFLDQDNAMRPLAQKWRASFGHFDPNVIALAISQQLLSRFAIIGLKPPSREPVWRFIGDAHQWLGSDYQYRGIGQKVEDIADKDYGEWVSEYLRWVATSGQPRYDLVTASIQYMNEPGTPRRTVNYERLLLPWKTTSGEVLVTSCAKIVAQESDTLGATGSDSSVTRKSSRSVIASVAEV